MIEPARRLAHQLGHLKHLFVRWRFSNAPSLGLVARFRGLKRMGNRRVKLALEVDLTRMFSPEEGKIAIET